MNALLEEYKYRHAKLFTEFIQLQKELEKEKKEKEELKKFILEKKYCESCNKSTMQN